MRSMTGYGRYYQKNDDYAVQVELRSVNSRYFEVQYRNLPSSLGNLEMKLNQYLKSKLKRGKVTVTFSIEVLKDRDVSMLVNEDLLVAYHRYLSEVAEKHQLNYAARLENLLHLPNVLGDKKDEGEPDENLAGFIYETAVQAADELFNMQSHEGRLIHQDIENKLIQLKEITELFARESVALLKDYEERLIKRIEELTEHQYSEERVLTEVAVMAEKSTIDEEITRLRAHFHSFEKMIKEEEQVGRKCDFMIQELNREMNTIGSKIQTITLSRAVCEGKSILENIREQIQNIV